MQGMTPMHHDYSDYGLWSLAIINSGVFILFVLSFFKPRTRRDWRSFSAFLIALLLLLPFCTAGPATAACRADQQHSRPAAHV
ncbi:MAG TPA: hypothetical protein VND19_24985 [Acetobacteraceae bacterium]|nr:hypothetical protein [Acetobacteraceae bacterium]